MPLLAAILDVQHLIQVFGYPLVFVLVMSESSGLPIPGETALIAGAVLASQRQAQNRARDPPGGARRDRRRQHRLPDRPQGRALAAAAPGRLPAPAPRGRSTPASRSSNATVRRRCSSGASSSACGCGPRGWPGPRACRGARSPCGTPSAGSAGRRRRPDRLLPRQFRRQRDRSLRDLRPRRCA